MVFALRWMAGLGGLVGVACASAADVPALDRVPAGSPVVVVIPHVGKFMAGMEVLAKLGAPMEEAQNLFKLDGLNKEGSAAAAFVPGPDGTVDFEAERPPMVLLVPVTDFGKFVTASGGDPAQQMPEVDPFDSGEPSFARNLGNGYALVAPDAATAEAFKGDGGNTARHQALLGATGRAALERCAVSVFLDIQALAPQIKSGLDQAREQMQGGMGGGGQEVNMAVLDAIGLTVVEDGQSTVFGAEAGDTGISLHWAAQFKEGSPSAAKLSGKGNAGTVLDRLPQQPFLFAMSVDTSLSGVKQMFKSAFDMAAKADPKNAEAQGLMGVFAKTLDTMDGMSLLMGAPPAGLMAPGGLFASTVAYVKTKDAAGYATAMKDAMTRMNGQTVQGFTYQTAYSAKSSDKPADEWSMRMQADPNDPNAQQTMMMMSMIFGPEAGLAGYLAPATDGVVMTYSKNQKLLEQSQAGAKSGGFTQNAGIQAVSGSLPENRVAEAYIGMGPILETVQMFMAMQGVGGDAEIPKDLPPIGIGGCTESGGVRATVFAPKRVLEAISQLTGAGNADGAGQPRF